MTRLRGLLLAALGLLPAAGVTAVGCSSPSSPAAPAGGEAGAGGEASTVADAGPKSDAVLSDGSTLLDLQWEVVQLAGPSGATEAGALDGGVDGAPPYFDGGGGDGGLPTIEGVMVCVYQSTNCATTAADGTFTLSGLPQRTNVTLTLNKTGFYPTLLAIQTASTPMDSRANPIYMFATSDAQPDIGATIDWVNKGQIGAFALGASPDGGNFVGDQGAMISLSPATAAGPFFVADRTGQFVQGATSFAGLQAWYYNAAPGMYTLSYVDSRNNCAPIEFPFAGWGFPVATPMHELQFPVLAGYITGLVGMICTPNPVVVDAGS